MAFRRNILLKLPCSAKDLIIYFLKNYSSNKEQQNLSKPLNKWSQQRRTHFNFLISKMFFRFDRFLVCHEIVEIGSSYCAVGTTRTRQTRLERRGGETISWLLEGMCLTLMLQFLARLQTANLPSLSSVFTQGDADARGQPDQEDAPILTWGKSYSRGEIYATRANWWRQDASVCQWQRTGAVRSNEERHLCFYSLLPSVTYQRTEGHDKSTPNILPVHWFPMPASVWLHPDFSHFGLH